MPAQTGKSSVLASLDRKELMKAYETHKTADVVHDEGGGLPPGIEGGVARLTKCYFGKYETGDHKGKPYFMAMGTCVVPKMHNDLVTYGRVTKIGPWPLCNTPEKQGKYKTMSDWWFRIRNILVLLGANPANVHPDTVEQECARLVKAAPYFKFRTWKGPKQKTGKYAGREPEVQHVWDEWVKWPPEGSPSTNGAAATVDETGDEAPPDEAPDESYEAPVDQEAAETEGGAPEMELASLASAADAGDDDAIATMTRLGLDAGLEEKVMEKAPNWVTVAQMIEEATAGAPPEEPPSEEPEEEGGEEAPGEEEPTEEEAPSPVADPQRGDMVHYQVIDPKTKKAAVNPKTKKTFKPVECEITSVDRVKKWATLKNIDDGKTVYKNVPWDKLIRE